MTLASFSLNAQTVNSVSNSIEPLVKSKKDGWVLEWKGVKNKIADLKWAIGKKLINDQA